MAEYSVMVQNEEGNDENVSVTGLVNGRQVAAVIKVSRLRQGKSAKAERERAQAKVNALVDAYLAMPAPQVNAGAVVVTRE